MLRLAKFQLRGDRMMRFHNSMYLKTIFMSNKRFILCKKSLLSNRQYSNKKKSEQPLVSDQSSLYDQTKEKRKKLE